MGNESDLLLAAAARLYSLGVDLEAAREMLRELVSKGTSYDSDEMRQAYQAFKSLEQQWQDLEKQYLTLRDELTGR